MSSHPSSILPVFPVSTFVAQGNLTRFVGQPVHWVRVRFPWRNPAFSNNDGSGDSGWVRVAQIATGAGTTSMWLPEVGDEVLVAFEHGDPHRPVIVGSLWNGKDMPPSSLPANKLRSIFQSQSQSGTINEIVLDDTSGNERLILRSGNQFLSLSPNGISASSAINIHPPGGYSAYNPRQD